jgi:cytochrome c5
MRKLLIALGLTSALLAFAGTSADAPKPSASTAISSNRAVHERWMTEGEKRYRANCSRCHQPPHKFPPGVMAMAVRHMRVRAMLTDEDTKYVLYYMTH